jgi:NAD(P)-dependent dehydrogenase (short-subunit alcohol dehydrogenase family)
VSDLGLEKKVMLVTGAGGGIGSAMVQKFYAEGASVAALDIDPDAAHKAVAQLADASRALALGADVTESASVSAAVSSLLERYGRIDVLCNNAGVSGTYLPAHEVPLEEWESVIAVNLTGPFRMARAVIPTMLDQSAGVIINTASVCSFSAGAAGTSYTSSKHGLLGLTRQLSYDYGRRGIRVNAICPGAVETPMTVGEGAGTPPNVQEELDWTPAGRWGRPSEIADFAAYLASDAAEFIHGSALVIDGGWLSSSRRPS